MHGERMRPVRASRAIFASRGRTPQLSSRAGWRGETPWKAVMPARSAAAAGSASRPQLRSCPVTLLFTRRASRSGVGPLLFQRHSEKVGQAPSHPFISVGSHHEWAAATEVRSHEHLPLFRLIDL